jgi:hypothetical protein
MHFLFLAFFAALAFAEVPGQDVTLANGAFIASAGVVVAGNDRGEAAVAPTVGMRVDGFDMKEGIHVDIAFRGGAAFAGGSTTDGFGASGVDAAGRFILSFVPGAGACRFRMGGGTEATHQTVSGGGSANDDDSGATIYRLSSLQPIRLESGALCTDGRNTIFFGPFAAVGMNFEKETANTSVDVGAFARLFVDTHLIATAAFTSSHPAGGAVQERVLDGRLSADARIKTFEHVVIFAGADARVTGRLDSNRTDMQTSSGVPSLGVAATARAGFMF